MTITRRTVIAAVASIAATVPAVGLAHAAPASSRPAAAAYSSRPTLSLGSQDMAVVEVQLILSVNGFGDLTSCIFDRQTRDQVIAFQKSRHLRADGVVGPATWAALEAVGPHYAQPWERVLRLGDRSLSVSFLQTSLARKGYRLPDTGYFGSMTRAAVIDFQKKHHLRVDGVVGPRTWDALLFAYTRQH